MAKINSIFPNLDEELIKLSINKNHGNTEETIMFLTEEKNIIDLTKELEEKKAKEKNDLKKKNKKEEDLIIPFEEGKINLLFDILNQEDNLINEEIWKLLGSIKYPDDLINTATSEELMNVISEPNLYKMLLNLKLVNSLVFDDKFCKFNKISPEKKLNWTSKFIKNESFVKSILNQMNNIGEIQEQNEIVEIKEKEEEKRDENSNGEKQVIKFQILSIFTNWFHNIFINMLDLIKNDYIQAIINDIKLCNSFTLHNPNNNENQNQIQGNNINNNGNNGDMPQKIETINEKDAKAFVDILSKNNIVKLFYKIIKTSISISKDYKIIIQLVLEMQLIYFSINKASIKYFLEEETNNKSLLYLISLDKNKEIRTIVLNFYKILLKNLNDFEEKEQIKNEKGIKPNEKIININEINEKEINNSNKDIDNKENEITNKEKIENKEEADIQKQKKEQEEKSEITDEKENKENKVEINK